MKQDEISIVLCGDAGQGIQTIEKLLSKIFHQAGFFIYATKEYMSRIRGGSNSTTLRISSRETTAYYERVDILIPFDQDAYAHMKNRLNSDTLILADKNKFVPDYGRVIHIPFGDLSQSAGGTIYTNVIAVALIAAILGIEQDLVTASIQKLFQNKPEFLEKNIQAVDVGYAKGRAISQQEPLNLPVIVRARLQDKIIVDGSTAVALGAIAGGCNFISAYPMTPGTGVMLVLAALQETFDIIVEQAEDEIAAVNMAIGAWYAGGRAMTSTAGGGFALMAEGVSLAGMVESPLVIHIGQRPAPATGLPTRTEQSDLNFVINSGHGEFPRLVLAPSTLQDAFSLSRLAFNLADKYQIPVFILTDQYFVDTFYTTDSFNPEDHPVETYLVESSPAYKRYAITPSGISPRSVPGWGAGMVAFDSDEHDESGHITEDSTVRQQMMDKRLRKFDAMAADSVQPVFSGRDDYEVLLVGWGSTYPVISAALRELNLEKLAYLHFTQVFPLPAGTRERLLKAKSIIVIENNATGQFAGLLTQQTGVRIDHKILKYNGLPFHVEEMTTELGNLLRS